MKQISELFANRYKPQFLSHGHSEIFWKVLKILAIPSLLNWPGKAALGVLAKTGSQNSKFQNWQKIIHTNKVKNPPSFLCNDTKLAQKACNGKLLAKYKIERIACFGHLLKKHLSIPVLCIYFKSKATDCFSNPKKYIVFFVFSAKSPFHVKRRISWKNLKLWFRFDPTLALMGLWCQGTWKRSLQIILKNTPSQPAEYFLFQFKMKRNNSKLEKNSTPYFYCNEKDFFQKKALKKVQFSRQNCYIFVKV